jgi:hypothetical protein
VKKGSKKERKGTKNNKEEFKKRGIHKKKYQTAEDKPTEYGYSYISVLLTCKTLRSGNTLTF